jgi:predicted ATPase/class 3 adenylate cyclase
MMMNHKPSTSKTLPTGTVTFLFTDIVGSTPLWERQPDLMAQAVGIHNTALRGPIEAHGGVVFKIVGDAFQAAFPTALQALKAAIEAQQTLLNAGWNEVGPLKVRMGLHTGEAELDPKGDEYAVSHTKNRVARIMSAAHGGQVLISLETKGLVDHQLPSSFTLLDLGEHRLKGMTVPEHLFQARAPGLESTFPLLASTIAHLHNLPRQINSFIGREHDIAQVKTLLNDHPLLTLTGSGGVGKTRLSIRTAEDLLEEFRDGIWYVELASLTDPDLVPRNVALILGLREEAGITYQELLETYLKSRQTLLILDNCEHLIAACARMTKRLLQACPQLKVLASSREAMGVPGEINYHVPSLSIPDAHAQPNPATMAEYDAVRLFVERARDVMPSFHLTKANAAQVVRICERLDGIPLALELAASRMNVLDTGQLADRLDNAFRLLTGGSRTALPRQQTLRATIDWSYQMFNEQERKLLIRLSVFIGGFSLEGAEAVCAGDGLEEWEILDLLASLVNKSMVTAERVQGEKTRYSLLEMVRQYGREKLFDAGESARLHDQHLEYYVRFAEQAEIEILHANQMTWLQRLDVEFDNIRAALEWSRENRVEDGLQLGSSIWRFCLRYGYTKELVERLNQLLLHPSAAKRTSARAKTLSTLSMLAVLQGDSEKTRPLAEESLAINRELGDQKGLAASLYALGVATNRTNDPAALSFLLQSLAAYRSLDDKIGISDALIVISQASNDPAQRQASLEESLELARERGDAITMAGALDNLGILALDMGNFAQARFWLEESLAMQRPLGMSGYVNTLQHLADLETYEGNYIEARALCEEGLSISKDAGMKGNQILLRSILGRIALQEGKWEEARTSLINDLHRFNSAGRTGGMLYTLEGFARLAARQGQLERATRLFAFAVAMREAKKYPLVPVDQALVDRDLVLVKTQLDDTTFEALWAEGGAMTLEQAVTIALQESNEPTS